MKRNSLDLDFNDVGRVSRIWSKVTSCRALFSLKVNRSASMNGVHFEMWCRPDCEVCRVVFDDSVRFMLDHHYRRTSEQNVLFQQKTFKKAGQHIIMKVSE